MSVATSVHSLILGRKVQGTAVFNPVGEKIGHVEDVSIHKTSGQVIYAILSFGGFLGLGERYHPVPWKVLSYDTSKNGYVIPLDKAALEEAPNYDLADLGDVGADSDLRYREPVFTYYGGFGAEPYWSR
jgi:sporulation protein YlmC with PRC-barrel domain